MPTLTTPSLQTLLSAGAVRSVGLVRRPSGVEVWIHAGPTLEDSGSEPLCTATGQPRIFPTVDAAAAVVRALGYRQTMTLDDAGDVAPWWAALSPVIHSADGWTAYTGPDHAGQFRFAVVDPQGCEYAEDPPGYASELDARQAAASLLVSASA